MAERARGRYEDVVEDDLGKPFGSTSEPSSNTSAMLAIVAFVGTTGNAWLGFRDATRDEAPITDDLPRIEFSAPRGYFHQERLGADALAWIAARLDGDASQRLPHGVRLGRQGQRVEVFQRPLREPAVGHRRSARR